MDKLYFRKPAPVSSVSKYPTIRVNADVYTMLVNISNEIGTSVSAVANRMLQFASEHTEVIDCNNPAPACCPVLCEK